MTKTHKKTHKKHPKTPKTHPETPKNHPKSKTRRSTPRTCSPLPSGFLFSESRWHHMTRHGLPQTFGVLVGWNPRPVINRKNSRKKPRKTLRKIRVFHGFPVFPGVFLFYESSRGKKKRLRRYIAKTARAVLLSGYFWYLRRWSTGCIILGRLFA